MQNHNFIQCFYNNYRPEQWHVFADSGMRSLRFLLCWMLKAMSPLELSVLSFFCFSNFEISYWCPLIQSWPPPLGALELCDSVTDFYGVWFLCLETRVFFFCYFMRSHCCVTTTLFFFSRGKLGIMAIVSECNACSYVMGDVADLYFRSPSFTLEIGECCHPWSSMDTMFLYFFIFQFFCLCLACSLSEGCTP